MVITGQKTPDKGPQETVNEKASGGGTKSTQKTMGGVKPPLPTKPLAAKASAGPGGKQSMEVVVVAAAEKSVAPKKKPPTASKGAGMSDRLKKGDRNFNRFRCLSDGHEDVEIE